MKILFLTNNAVSDPLLAWLRQSEDVIVRQDKITASDVLEIMPEIVVSYSYMHIIKADTLATLPGRFINLHISLLPYNRGADPNAWSLLENTPKGVSIHLIDQGIDTGQVLVQRAVAFDEASETLGSSYRILHEEIQALFRENWHLLRIGAIAPHAVDGAGTFHLARQFSAVRDELLGEEGWDVPIAEFKARYARRLGASA